ncbi:MAG: alkaline phosphatase family protein [Steroidobacteraceae bacterium]
MNPVARAALDACIAAVLALGAGGVLAAPDPSAAPISHAASTPFIGVSADPCLGVPLEPTPAHKAAADPYDAWMHEWLALDWSQQCRYRHENAALPPPSAARVVFIGDSITEGWKPLDPAFFTGEVLDRGISGQTSAQMLARFRADVLDLHPAVVHIMAGTNDVAGNTGPTSLAQVQGNVMSMVELARAHGIGVVLAAVPPAARFWWHRSLEPADTIIALNRWLRGYAARERLVFVDYHAALDDGHGGLATAWSDDGVHPNAAGYAAMRPLAQAAIAQALAARSQGAAARSAPATVAPAAPATRDATLAPGRPRTPIEHLIVVVGENRSFDSVFATFRPRGGATVRNLLSLGIVNTDGSPGPHFALAAQRPAVPQPRYSIDPPRGAAYAHLPQPRLVGVEDAALNGLANGADTRFPADLPNGPFPATRFVPYWRGSLPTGDPVHRFFQMWQQTGGDNARLDLYAWVGMTTGIGPDNDGVTPADPGQGGEPLGFLNMATGDAPYLRELAERYALSDNYHQPVMGGTGMNFFALATGDLPVFNLDGRLTAPPANQVEDPDPVPGTANFYRRDGYRGGSYVNCADATQPGVAPILGFLERHRIASRCADGAWYLVNNYATLHDRLGAPRPLGPGHFVYPPQDVPTIAEALAAAGVSWKWYAGGRDDADLQADMRRWSLPLEEARGRQYNDNGDPLLASRAVMRDPRLRAQLQGLDSFQRDLRTGRLPAVSFIVPKNHDSGHPGYSEPAHYEEFLRTVVQAVQARPALWAHTAILATTDEGGGYFDSGYIQPLDFFGDGPRIPLLAISPFARRGHVDHVYADHASILKFIERNWGLAPLSARSRDSLPDPLGDPTDPYRPVNGPAIGDLMSLFEF